MPKKLSVELARFFLEEAQDQRDRTDSGGLQLPTVTLAEILALAEERVFGFLFVILALPSALPVPAPGYSIPFGVAMLILAVQLMVGAKHPWLPQRILQGSIARDKVKGFVNMGIPWLQRIEAITCPRMSYICTSVPGRVVIGLAIALMSASMMIPIPGTNTLPAIGIFVTAFGLQEDDGFISLGGLMICLLALVVVLGIFIGGISLIDVIKDWLLAR